VSERTANARRSIGVCAVHFRNVCDSTEIYRRSLSACRVRSRSRRLLSPMLVGNPSQIRTGSLRRAGFRHSAQRRSPVWSHVCANCGTGVRRPRPRGPDMTKSVPAVLSCAVGAGEDCLSAETKRTTCSRTSVPGSEADGRQSLARTAGSASEAVDSSTHLHFLRGDGVRLPSRPAPMRVGLIVGVSSRAVAARPDRLISPDCGRARHGRWRVAADPMPGG
jgi:hypothetical protein